MNKSNVVRLLKSRTFILACGCTLPLLVTTCRYKHQQEQRELDQKIATLDKKIYETQDLYTASVPQNLRSTQSRMIKTADSLDKQADTLAFCLAQNDSLVSRAFNNYAVRIGQDFQISKYLPATDIAIFQKHIAVLDSGEYVQEMARTRILQNNGSLHDLSYFFELLDFDSINMGLENKLAWNFYTDTTAGEMDTQNETTVLNFEKPELNTALNHETSLLNLAWKQNISPEYNNVDSVKNDTLSVHTNPDTVLVDNKSGVNFSIPEFDYVRTQYMHNDSVIQAYNNAVTTMLNAEDTLEQYRQTIRRQRDSLYQRKRELEK